MTGTAASLALGLAVALDPNTMPTYWFVIPLVLAMSCVYSASRSESWPRIIGSTLRWFGLIMGVLVGAVAILLVLNSQVG